MNNKTLIGIVIAAVIVVVLIVVGTRSKSTPGTTPTMLVSSISTSPSASPTSPAPIAKTLTYAQALQKYSATRIQFDATCQAHPSSMVIKKGTAIMLDNRSPKARTVAIGSVKYYLVGYGFRIVVPTSKTYPSTQLVDCGAAQNVATILIER